MTVTQHSRAKDYYTFGNVQHSKAKDYTFGNVQPGQIYMFRNVQPDQNYMFGHEPGKTASLFLVIGVTRKVGYRGRTFAVITELWDDGEIATDTGALDTVYVHGLLVQP